MFTKRSQNNRLKFSPDRPRAHATDILHALRRDGGLQVVQTHEQGPPAKRTRTEHDVNSNSSNVADSSQTPAPPSPVWEDILDDIPDASAPDHQPAVENTPPLAAPPPAASKVRDTVRFTLRWAYRISRRARQQQSMRGALISTTFSTIFCGRNTTPASQAFARDPVARMWLSFDVVTATR